MSKVALKNIKSGLYKAIDKKKLSIEYSQAGRFAEVFEKEAKEKYKNKGLVEVSDFDVKDLTRNVAGKCGITMSSIHGIIEKVILGKI
ncbi:hypothetical protein KAJ41_01840 [Candidatus Parcubacteria bacterium]|nr:hypothetical protein [Candidatus Parcubacteria bacterium]